MLDSDFAGLPAQTQQFVKRIRLHGLDRERIHGLFVMLGLSAGMGPTQDELDNKISLSIPIDETKSIEELAGHVYGGYEKQIGEFCYRSGEPLTFRKTWDPRNRRSVCVIKPKDYELLECDVMSIERLADAFHLYDAFMAAIGRDTANQQASLVDSFACGRFQLFVLATNDLAGARQIAALVKSRLPLIYGEYFSTLMSNGIDHFLSLERGQVPLLNLMQPMDRVYAEQMWAFQSRLFYRNQRLIDGVDGLGVRDWHTWVLGNARNFDTDYPRELVPFSRSNVVLADAPLWHSTVEAFEICDQYIGKVWGYRALSLSTDIETLEYKALVVYLMYSSLTSARELSKPS